LFLQASVIAAAQQIGVTFDKYVVSKSCYLFCYCCDKHLYAFAVAADSAVFFPSTMHQKLLSSPQIFAFVLYCCRTIEIRDPDEVDEAVRSELDPPNGGSPIPGGSTTGSAAASLSHDKPLRPGRGGARPKVSKFQLDADTTM
jgi:hypothetical protein